MKGCRLGPVFCVVRPVRVATDEEAAAFRAEQEQERKAQQRKADNDRS